METKNSKTNWYYSFENEIYDQINKYLDEIDI